MHELLINKFPPFFFQNSKFYYVNQITQLFRINHFLDALERSSKLKFPSNLCTRYTVPFQTVSTP